LSSIGKKIEVVFQFWSYYTPAHFQLFHYLSWRAGAGRADDGYIKIKANLSPVELNWDLAELGKNVPKIVAIFVSACSQG
jgi:hypothetical protein